MTDSKLIVTKYNGQILSLLFMDGVLTEANAYPDTSTAKKTAESPSAQKRAESDHAEACGTKQAECPLGAIYVGKVSHVLKNIEAAFVEVAKGKQVFLPLSRFRKESLLNRRPDGRVLAGDELLVQIEKEAVKTKDPVATTELSLTGRYLVALPVLRRHPGLQAAPARDDAGASFKDPLKETIPSEKPPVHGRIQFSGKLSPDEKRRILDYLNANEDFHTCLQSCTFIIRTNAGELEDYAPIVSEAVRMCAEAGRILHCAASRTCYSCLYRPEPAWLTEIRDTYHDQFSEIVTDDEGLYRMLHAYLEDRYPEELGRLRLYQGPRVSLSNLYGIRARLREATESRVWLKSGGYLVIEPTEALTVIDVNSGKYSGRKGSRDTFLLINREAACEIARQLRLRNLSGIIIADFINMEDKADEKQLLECLSQELKKDPVKTAVVDMTPLGLVEITRKKVRKSLREQMAPGEA